MRGDRKQQRLHISQLNSASNRGWIGWFKQVVTCFSRRRQLRCCGFRGGGHGRGLLMLSTAAASCCLLLSSTSTLAVASLSAPAAAAATCSRPTGGALLRHVSNHSRRVGAVFSGRRRRRREEEARLRLAGRGGVIPGRRYCEGMQQRRPCFVGWRI